MTDPKAPREPQANHCMECAVLTQTIDDQNEWITKLRRELELERKSTFEIIEEASRNREENGSLKDKVDEDIELLMQVTLERDDLKKQLAASQNSLEAKHFAEKREVILNLDRQLTEARKQLTESRAENDAARNLTILTTGNMNEAMDQLVEARAEIERLKSATILQPADEKLILESAEVLEKQDDKLTLANSRIEKLREAILERIRNDFGMFTNDELLLSFDVVKKSRLGQALEADTKMAKGEI